MFEVSVAGREWRAEPTGYRATAYTMTSGVKMYKGVRAPSNPDIIRILDHSNRYIGAFSERTGREIRAVQTAGDYEPGG